VLLSSLGWANCPTHQNTDLAGTLLARPWPRLRLVCPTGATSAGSAVANLLDSLTDGIGVVVYSKQALLDLGDPGARLVGVRRTQVDKLDGVIVAVGDVCLTEAVGALTLAAEWGVNVGVLAVVDVTALRDSRLPAAWLRPAVVGVSWCSASFVSPLLWRAAARLFPIAGYAERWGATAWETLLKNGMDRASLLAALAAEGCPLPGARVAELQGAVEPDFDGSGVPRFAADDLFIEPIALQPAERASSR
jgi:xylulose-5-phosphate/fructose-6-phosphate phosphoketolase